MQMGLGGPVWHASAAPRPGSLLPAEHGCRAIALDALDGVGDATLGEWHHWTGHAYHIRRRLSTAEQTHVGPVVDVRGTDEAQRRFDRLPAHVRQLAPADVLLEELGP